MLDQPNLFLVGFQKCGSSALFDLLIKHPDIKGSTPKETFFLVDKVDVNYSINNIRNINSSWSTYDLSTKKASYFLEGSVCNYYQETALNHIKNLDESKVVFVMRDPVDRFVSNYKYYSLLIQSKKKVSIKEYYDNIKKGVYTDVRLKDAIEHGRYEVYLDKWINEIGEHRVLILSYKQLVKEPALVFNKVCDFLNLPYLNVDIILERKNESSTIRYRWLHVFLIRFLHINFPLKESLRKIYTCFFKKKHVVSIDDSTKKLLILEYKNTYQKFNQYF